MNRHSARLAAGSFRTLSIAIAMATAITLSAGTPGASAAEASADIPGVPLPGPVAAGRLGGAIYDVVYSLSVAPGHVIVASLTGTAGTDFDIYVFDATATTVVSESGLLIKSTGPTSTESIAWPSQFGGTYYIDLNGATDVEGDYRLSVQTIPDPTAPLASLVLANGRSSTNQFVVSATITASDDLSGVTAMAFSADGLVFDDWQPFAPTSTWTFPPGDTTRTLWAKVRNGVGLESMTTSDSVVIDTVPPALVAIEPSANSIVVGLTPTFSVSFSEAIDAASWIDLGLVVQSSTGALVSGSYAYDVASKTGSFVPAKPLAAGATFIVTVGGVTDIAGNSVKPVGSWSIVPLVPTKLGASATPQVVLRGASTRMEVSLSGAPFPATIDVLGATGSGAFVSLGAIPAEDGVTSFGASPLANTTYRFRYNGVFGVAPAQADVRVLVRRTVALVGVKSSTTSRARIGAPIKLTAAIGPPEAGVSVSFKLYRFDVGRRAWVYAGSRGRSTDATGRASYTWVPPATGSWYWRVAVAPTVDFANNTSLVYRWSISR
jgi:hypothetical protein